MQYEMTVEKDVLDVDVSQVHFAAQLPANGCIMPSALHRCWPQKWNLGGIYKWTALLPA